MFRFALRAVGGIQIILGIAYLLMPNTLLLTMGHSIPSPDLLYPLGMLSSRFLAYGIGLWIISAEPEKHVLWVRLMAFIQLIDFSVGAFYTVIGIVPMSLSIFPMFNAIWIGLLLAFWKPASVALMKVNHA